MKKEAYYKLLGLKKCAADNQWLPKNHENYNTPVSIDADIFGRGIPRYATPPENTAYTVPGRQVTYSNKSTQIPNNKLFQGQKVSVPRWFPRSSIYLTDLMSEIPTKGLNGEITNARRKGYRQALEEYKKSLKHMEQNVNKSPQLSKDLLMKEFAEPIPSISKANGAR